MPKYITTLPEQTFALGEKLAHKIKTGLILALIGDLGTGKTTFAQGLGAGLGLKELITSPSFIIMKVYPLPKHKFLQYFCHIDAYRLKNSQELKAVGALDYFIDPKALVLIEWAEKIKDILPKNSQIITFSHLAPKKRLIKMPTTLKTK